MNTKLYVLKELKTNVLWLALVLCVSVSCSKKPKIVVQDLQMEIPAGELVFSEELLTGEIADTKIEHFAFSVPTNQTLLFSEENVNILLFIKGNGKLRTLSNRDIEINAFPFYFFVNCLREVRNIS